MRMSACIVGSTRPISVQEEDKVSRFAASSAPARDQQTQHRLAVSEVEDAELGDGRIIVGGGQGSARRFGTFDDVQDHGYRLEEYGAAEPCLARFTVERKKAAGAGQMPNLDSLSVVRVTGNRTSHVRSCPTYWGRRPQQSPLGILARLPSPEGGHRMCWGIALHEMTEF